MFLSPKPDGSQSNHWALKGSVLRRLVNVTMKGDSKSSKRSCFKTRLYVYRMRKFYPFSVTCLLVYQYSETNVLHILFNLLRIKDLYMFRALLAHPQEALNM
jgi:hypothetical protein